MNRKMIFLLLLSMATMPMLLAAEPKTVAKLDVKRYLGDWYEIASYPQWFQKGCTATKANYQLKANGDIQVTNSCRLENPNTGEIKEAKGLAWVVDQESKSKLKVQFFLASWFKSSWFGGDYWVIGLGENYEYALVSDPSKEYLWILSRTPTMEPAKLEVILAQLQGWGYDLSKLKYTEHPK